MTSSCFGRLTLAVGLVIVAAGTGSAVNRDAEVSVVLGRMPGTVLDTVERVEMEVTDNQVNVSEVWFVRQPYALPDGTMIRQTPSYASDVYVRQMIEHPHASRTIIAYPTSTDTVSPAADRALAMLDTMSLNPDRPASLVVPVSDGFDVWSPSPGGTAGGPSVPARHVPNGSAGAVLAQYLGYGWIPLARHDGMNDAASPSDAANRKQAVEVSPDYFLDLVHAGDQVLAELLDGQGLVVVEHIEREIRSHVRTKSDISNAEVAQLNQLQDELAKVLGRTDVWKSVFGTREQAARDAPAILRDIDVLLGSDTVRTFADGMRRIEDLFLTRLPTTLGPLAGPSEEERPESGIRSEPREFLADLPAGTLAIVEGDDELILDLFRESLESSAYNLVIMSGDGGGASIADLTEHGPSSADLVIHPGLSGPSGSLQLTGTREYELKLNAMRLKLMSALNDIPVGHAVVTSQAVTTRATLIALGGQLPDRVVTFYLVPGTTPSEIAENARELVEAGAVTNPVAARMLLRWAAVVTTAMDL